MDKCLDYNNCFYSIIRHYSTGNTNDLEKLEDKYNTSNITKQLIIWYLKNGSIVKCSTRNDIKKTLYHQIEDLTYMRDFWATQITDTIWEVQFSRENDPDVKCIVTANTGSDAARLAKDIIMNDYNSVEIINYEIL